MVTDINWIYGGDNFTALINIESLCTPETNIMLHINYIAIKKEVTGKTNTNLPWKPKEHQTQNDGTDYIWYR